MLYLYCLHLHYTIYTLKRSMEKLNRNTAKTNTRPIKVIQIGEGNFLRGFADWIIWRMNKNDVFNGGVAVIQPTDHGKVHLLEEQNGLYHVNLQGIDRGKIIDSLELVDVIQMCINPYQNFEEFLRLAEHKDIRFLISNTTEAGIVFDASCRLNDTPAISFPGKLVQWLYHRYQYFQGNPEMGLILLPCELIFRNGDELKKCIYQYMELWQLGNGFQKWFDNSCTVCCTLVDRIVPGFPKDDIDKLQLRTGYEDRQIVKAEAFHLWVIEAPEYVAQEFPAAKAGLNVKFVANETPYHIRKVALLNGVHTVLSPVGLLCGLKTVGECMEDSLMCRYIHQVMQDELMITLDMPFQELKEFAHDVLERFANPYIRHQLTSIMLNSFPKFRTRDLPGLRTFLQRKGRLPEGLVLGLAAIIVYYRGGQWNGEKIVPEDDQKILALLNKLWNEGDLCRLVRGVLEATDIWGENLYCMPGLAKMLENYVQLIQGKGMRAVLEQTMNKS